MRCPKCGTDSLEGARFCRKCGAKLVLVCAVCGGQLTPDAQFCEGCGAPVSRVTPDPFTESIRRLVPREFADRLLATRGKVGMERRLVTILFSDVKGSTALAEKADPEDVMEIMKGAFDFLIPPIYRYEGTLARLMGDAVLAFFGAPIAHEDDPERACRAALEILSGAKEYAAQLETQRGLPGFSVRVGIHTGLVVVGEVGSDLRVEYTAMGDAINLASRMESAAEPGTVLVTEDTHRLVAPLFETESLGRIEVKGRVEPVPAYRVLSARPGVGKVRGIRGLDSPLVGRDAELHALQEAVERLQAGVGGIATVVGDAGLGKSRLVAELRKGTDLKTVSWVEGRCLSYGTSIAYLLWLDMLRRLMAVSEEAPPAEMVTALHKRLAIVCPEQSGEVYPYLARLLSLPVDPAAEARLRDMDGRALKAATFGAMETVLQCASKQQPLVVVCEDLHWADATSIELLEHLLPLTDRAPLLMICVMRPERDQACWKVRTKAMDQYPHRHTDVMLNPLRPADSDALVGNLLRVEGLPVKLKYKVLQQAEGNPFYVEEVIRSLIDSGAIARDETTGQWRATRDVADIAIPETLQGVIQARIDRLQEDTRKVLQMASVIGRQFLYRVLAAMMEEELGLDKHLVRLQREEMIRERTRVPELEYIFKHYLTQEATYEGILKRDRKACHKCVAQALEQLFPDRRHELAGFLAYHWERAEDAGKAIEYLLRAGDQARMVSAHAEAVGFYERALALLKQQGDLDRAARTLLKVGLTWHTAFGYQKSRDSYDQAFELWQKAAAPARVQLQAAPHPLRLNWAEPLSLDPSRTSDSDSIYLSRQLFRGLIEGTPELDIVPDAAESWETSEGGRQYVFRLRDDLYWSDGRPLTAVDFQYAWTRILHPTGGAVNPTGLYDIKNARAFHQGEIRDPGQLGVRAPDARTFVVELEGPTAYFLNLLNQAMTFAVPRHVVEARGDSWTDVGQIVTSGPFRLAAHRRGESMILERNDAYRGRARGNVRRVELCLLPLSEHLRVFEMYEMDELDILYALGFEGLARRRFPGEFVPVPLCGTTELIFNALFPPFDDVRSRRAFAMAIDKERLPRVREGWAWPASGGLVPPGTPGHSPGIAPLFDPERARRSLAEVGHSRVRESHPPRIWSFGRARATPDELCHQWREYLGVEVDVQATDDPDHMRAEMEDPSANMYLAGWYSFPDPDDFLRAGVTGPFARLGWRNEDYVALLDRGKACMDPVARLRLYRQADSMLAEEVPMLPLYYSRGHLLVKPWVSVPFDMEQGAGILKDAIVKPH